MPTFMVFRHGEPILKLIGSRPRRKLEAELADALAL
jgi:thioredoxin 1